MSETKKHLIITERPGTHLEVVSVNGRPAIIATDEGGRMVYFSPEQAPALALAILEAAGVKPQHHMEMAAYAPETLELVAHLLTLHVADSGRKAKEAADREKLEGRRGELAVQYFEGAYEHLPRISYRRAIDRIIELEDQAATK